LLFFFMALLTPVVMGVNSPSSEWKTTYHPTKIYADGPVPWPGPKKPSPTPTTPRISQEFMG
jgi:hypothetical protein